MCDLGSMWGHWQLDQYLTVMHELTLWNPFSVERYLAQPRHLCGEGIVLPQQGGGDSTDLVYFPGEDITLIRNVRGIWCREEGRRGGAGGEEEGGIGIGMLKQCN